ncbi:MAG TPA: GerW family sporulation protein [Clostridiales bacterium]|nr:GerW family sporulation protein [Clostridiales bacterium]
MLEHPIEGLMTTAMESIKEMVDVNTIVGDAVQAPDGTVIIPISKVSFGFAAGGGEYSGNNKGGKKDEERNEEGNAENSKFPFAGGSGAGVSINPVAFMVVGNGQIKLLPVNINSSVEKILDLIPELINKANESVKKKIIIKKDIGPDKEHDADTDKKE